MYGSLDWHEGAVQTGAVSVRKLPNLSPTQVVELQDALLADAKR